MPDRYARSRAQHERALRSLAGGVATAFRAPQLPVPISFARGRGSHLTDLDGNHYVDFALAFGPMLLGHAPDSVTEAVRRQLEIGIGYGASHAAEAELAEAICRMVPCADRCVFSSTGSEAVHAAIRIARAATGRNRVIKFQGHFHGWLDPLSVGVPGAADASPASAGQDPNASSAVSVCPWNDIEALSAALNGDVAAVIMEPLAVNGGCFSPAPGYLEAVRQLTARTGTVLIFDEVITGFRLAPGGAQQRFGVTPDLAIFAKALGSGFPISAVAGRADLMDEVASRRVRHAGTLNANPISVAASLATLTELERDGHRIYPHLEATGDGLAAILREECADAELPVRVNQVGAMGYAFWSAQPVDDDPASLRADSEAYRRFAAALLDEGVHVISRGLLYVSTAHTQADLDETRESVRRAAQRVRASLDEPVAAGGRNR
ncbi:MAG: aminotransferase class III-fold pyridoxal phosphate-dependent enzyme [Chloroflexi bacterium]|nr:aminotransferase class III-fold pyridoxal phosphate-dependent enzyme [Chloroflexota bacterium]